MCRDAKLAVCLEFSGIFDKFISQSKRNQICSRTLLRFKSTIQEERTCNDTNCELSNNQNTVTTGMHCVQHHHPDRAHLESYPLQNNVAMFEWTINSSSLRNVFYAMLSAHNLGSWIDLKVDKISVPTTADRSEGSSFVLQPDGSTINSLFEGQAKNAEFRISGKHVSKHLNIFVEANTLLLSTPVYSSVVHKVNWLAKILLTEKYLDFIFFLFGELKSLKILSENGKFQ